MAPSFDEMGLGWGLDGSFVGVGERVAVRDEVAARALNKLYSALAVQFASGETLEVAVQEYQFVPDSDKGSPLVVCLRPGTTEVLVTIPARLDVFA